MVETIPSFRFHGIPLGEKQPKLEQRKATDAKWNESVAKQLIEFPIQNELRRRRDVLLRRADTIQEKLSLIDSFLEIFKD